MALRDFGLHQVFPHPSHINESEKADIDIVAIHGLDTQSPKTWVAWKKDGDPESGEVHWLKDNDMLPSVIKNARIFTYDWNANYDQNAETKKLLGHADDLLDLLYMQRHNDSSNQPIIFVASCFGGLLLAKALHRASESHSPHQEILRSTVGIAFLGTPFQGSHEGFFSAAQLRVIIAKSMSRETSEKFIKYLESDDATELDELVQRFCEMVNNSRFRIPIVCFYETHLTDFTKVVQYLPPRFVNRLRSDKTGILVGERSACLQGQKRVGLGVRHAMLNKYARPEDWSFKRVAFHLKDFAQSAQKILQDKS